MADHTKKVSLRSLISASCVLFAASAARAQYTFTGLGDLSGGAADSWAKAVSYDGNVIVGHGTDASGTLPVKWTGGVLSSLGDLLGGTVSGRGEGVSGNGLTIVGYGTAATGVEAALWPGASALTRPSWAFTPAQALGISNDGAIIVGFASNSASDLQAFRYASGLMTNLGDLATGANSSTAYATNLDGSVVVGFGTVTAGTQAFRWTSTGGLIGLGELAGGTYYSVAYAVSGDGNTVVGTSRNASGLRAFRWTAATGMTLLGTTSGTAVARGISHAGDIIVGSADLGSGTEAFLWTATTGIVGLKSYLSSNGATGMTGWTLSQASAISGDGTTIVGYGINPTGGSEAFRVTIPSTQPPVANADSYTVTAGQTLNVSAPGVLSNDTNVSGATAVLVAPPANSAAFNLLSDGSFSYRPNSSFIGSDTFTYRASRSSLLSGVATVSITVAPTLTSLNLSESSVIGGETTTLTASINGNAPGGGVSVNLADNSSSVNADLVGPITVAAGTSSGSAQLTTQPVSSDTSITITASLTGGNSVTATLTVLRAMLTDVALSSNTVAGGASFQATVSLDGAAPSGGVGVSLSDNQACVLSESVGSVTIPEGATEATATIGTEPTGSDTLATVTASYGGVNRTDTITVLGLGLASLTASAAEVNSGYPFTVTVTLGSAAPTGGLLVSLGDDRASVLSEGVTANVAAGTLSATATIPTNPVTTDTTATITATAPAGATASTTILLKALKVTSLSLSSASVAGGSSVTGTVTTTFSASANTSIALSDTRSETSVPDVVQVTAAASTATFTVTTSTVATSISSTITATLNGASASAVLEVKPPQLASLSLAAASVYGGSPTTGTVSLSGSAPSPGTTVSLSSPTPNIFFPNGTSVTVGTGATSASFPIQTLEVPTTTTYTLSASFDGTTKTANLQLLPLQVLTNFVLSPANVYESQNVTATLYFNRAAPPGGTVVSLAAVESGDYFALPATVTVPQGRTNYAFAIRTKNSGATAILRSLRATLRSVSKTASVTIHPITVTGLTATPTTVTGQTTISLTVTLNAPAGPGGVIVYIAKGNKISAPANITIPGGKSTHTFTVTALTVTVRTVQNITLQRNGVGKTVTITMNPPPPPN